MTIVGTITASAINFGYGLYQGVKGREEEMELDASLSEHFARTKIKKCESCPKSEKCEDYNTSQTRLEKIGKMKSSLPFLKYLPMGLAGAMYLTISNLSDPSLENVVPLFTGLAGRYIGAQVWKRKNQEKIQRYEQVIQTQDIDSIAEGLVTSEQRRATEATLNALETRLLAGEEIEEKEFEEIMKKGYDSFTDKPEAYTPLLLDWSLKKFKKGLERIKMQKNLKEIYDRKDAGVAMVGVPENPQIRLYSKEGNKILVQDFDLGDFSIQRRKVGPGVMLGLNLPRPKVTTIEALGIDDNYRAAAEKILSCEDNKTRMVFNRPEGVSDSLRNVMITSTFLPAFESYHQWKSENEEKNQKPKQSP